jgi:hypothetical protein
MLALVEDMLQCCPPSVRGPGPLHPPPVPCGLSQVGRDHHEPSLEQGTQQTVAYMGK